MKIGIVGPSRRNHGTGPFVARFFHAAGARVAALCATTQASAEWAAADLGWALGRPIRAFGSLAEMLDGCGLDAVAICSPTAHHEQHLRAALEAGVHVFCEKPLIWNGAPEMSVLAKELIHSFSARGLLLQENTQWAFVVDDLARIAGRGVVPPKRSFEMMMAPPAPDASMFWESVPHPVSLLVALGVSECISGMVCCCDRDLTWATIEFLARGSGNNPLEVRIVLEPRAAQPRPCYLKLDGVLVRREILSLSPYQWALTTVDRSLPIEDPLWRSVKEFVRRWTTGGIDGARDSMVRQFQLLEALWPAVRSVVLRS